MQGDPSDESSMVDDDGLTPEEWAELERLTDPGADPAPGDDGPIPEGWAELERLTDPGADPAPGEQSEHSASPDWSAIAASVEPSEPTDCPEPSQPAGESVGGGIESSAELSAEAVGVESSVDVVPSAEAVGVESSVDVVPSGEPVGDGVLSSAELSGEPDQNAAEQSVVESGNEEAAASPPKMPLPRVIAVANQKGGVGKTTTTVNIAACLAEQGFRTLLVDLDPQANASTGVGIDSRQLDHSMYDVMLHDQAADSVIEPTEIKNLFVLPSSLDLAGAEIELVSLLSREHRLRLAIESVLDDYDYVLIDCPPSLGLLTINALTAAREVLVPIQCEYYALEGLGQLMRNIELVRASLNPGLQISHIVLVMFDPRTKLAGQVVDEVRTHFGSMVCEHVIPRTVRLSEAPSFGQPITTFDSGSRGAAAYRAVTQEVLGGQA